jgi:hypothetical protein
VVAAQKDRQASGYELGLHGIVDQPIPGDHFRQGGSRWRGDQVERATEVALVPDVGHKAAKGVAEASDAKCSGPMFAPERWRRHRSARR